MPSAPLVPVALVYLLGLLLGEGLQYFPLTLLLFLFLSVPPLHFLRLKLGWSVLRFGLFFILLLLGLLVRQFSLVDQEGTISDWTNQGRIRLLGKVEGFPRHGPERTRFRLQALSVRDPATSEWRKTSGLIRVTLRDPEKDILPGDLLEFETRLSAPRGYWNPGVFDYGARLKRHGIHAVAYLSNPDKILFQGTEGKRGFRAIQQYRDRIRRAIVNGTEGSTRAILLSMIIGEEDYLTQPLRDDFMASGTIHILSISGSHLGLVALMVFGMARYVLRYLPAPLLLRLTLFLTPSQVAAFITLFPVFFYAMLAGGQVATLRSLIMIVVYLMAVFLGRKEAIFNSLALAALITMLWDPGAPLDLSFQLSYLSVLAIGGVIYLHKRQPKTPNPPTRWDRWRNRLSFSLGTTLAVTLVTAPLTLYHFHQTSWVGLFANWVVVPIAGFLVVPLGLVTSFLVLFFDLSLLPLATLQTVVGEGYLWIVSLFARIPGAQIHLPSPPLTLLFLLYFIPLLFLLIPRRLRWVFLSFVWLPFLGWGFFALPSSSQNLQLTFLDIGQGDAALVRFPDRKIMLIDGGGSFGSFDTGRAVVAPFLWEEGISRVDYLVASHPQLDHIGGLITILKRFEVGEVWTNGVDREIPFAKAFQEEISARGIVHRVVHRAQNPVQVGVCEVGILNPSNRAEQKGLNNGSIVQRIDCPDSFSVLFTGDIEEFAEKDLVRSALPLKAEVLKVPHHGGRGSLDAEFLQRVSPEVAVISVGSRNRYGHPSLETLSAYEQIGAQVFRTDHGGAIRVTGKRDALKIQRFSETFLEEISFDWNIWKREWKNYQRAVTGF